MKNRVYISDIPGIYYIDNFVKDKDIDLKAKPKKEKLKTEKK